MVQLWNREKTTLAWQHIDLNNIFGTIPIICWLAQQQYLVKLNIDFPREQIKTIFGETKNRFSRRVLLLRFRLRSPQGTLIRVGVRPEWGRLAMYIRVSQNKLFSKNRLTKGVPRDGWFKLYPDQSYLSHFPTWYSKSGHFFKFP